MHDSIRLHFFAIAAVCFSCAGAEHDPATAEAVVEDPVEEATDTPPAESVSPEVSAAEARELLDQYVKAMRAIAATDDPEPMREYLRELAGRTVSIDTVEEFGERFRRMVRVSDALFDDEKSRSEETETVLKTFFEEVTGEKIDEGKPLAPAEMSPALEEELVSLYMMVDGTADRDAARQRYLGAGPREE